MTTSDGREMLPGGRKRMAVPVWTVIQPTFEQQDQP